MFRGAEKYRPVGAVFLRQHLFLGVLVLALLVGNTAGGLASRLAGGLALAAATVLDGLCNILSFDSIDSLHCIILRLLID